MGDLSDVHDAINTITHMSWILDFMMRLDYSSEEAHKGIFFFKREASEAAWCLLVGGHKYLCINSNYRLGPAQAWGWEGIDTSYKYKWSWKDTGVLSGRPPIYVFLIYFFPSDSTQSVRLLQTKANRLQNTEYLLVASTRESQDRYSCLLYSKKIETGFASQCFYSIRGLC